jgi:ABC-type glycerol-3-phosphate transport system substrate-binding protein
LFSSLLLAGCITPSTALSAPVKTTIRVMTFFAYDNPEVEKAVVAAFEDK